MSYDYQVAGRSYTGNRISISDGEYNIRDGAVQAIRGLQEGQRLPVYYNPDDPSEAVLRPGATFASYALLAIPLGLFGLGILMLLGLLLPEPIEETVDPNSAS